MAWVDPRNRFSDTIPRVPSGGAIFFFLYMVTSNINGQKQKINDLKHFTDFWLNSQLDILVIQCYAPGHSRFNPIERYWSYLTKWLVGVVLPVDLNGVIPSESDSESWNIILNNAATMCARFWNGKKVDGHKVTAEPFTSDSSLIEDMKKTPITP